MVSGPNASAKSASSWGGWALGALSGAVKGVASGVVAVASTVLNVVDAPVNFVVAETARRAKQATPLLLKGPEEADTEGPSVEGPDGDDNPIPDTGTKASGGPSIEVLDEHENPIPGTQQQAEVLSDDSTSGKIVPSRQSGGWVKTAWNTVKTAGVFYLLSSLPGVAASRAGSLAASHEVAPLQLVNGSMDFSLVPATAGNFSYECYNEQSQLPSSSYPLVPFGQPEDSSHMMCLPCTTSTEPFAQQAPLLSMPTPSPMNRERPTINPPKPNRERAPTSSSLSPSLLPATSTHSLSAPVVAASLLDPRAVCSNVPSPMRTLAATPPTPISLLSPTPRISETPAATPAPPIPIESTDSLSETVAEVAIAAAVGVAGTIGVPLIHNNFLSPTQKYERIISCANRMRCKVTYELQKGLSDQELREMDTLMRAQLDDVFVQGFKAGKGDKFTVTAPTADGYIAERKFESEEERVACRGPHSKVRMFTPEEMRLPTTKQIIMLGTFLQLNKSGQLINGKVIQDAANLSRSNEPGYEQEFRDARAAIDTFNTWLRSNLGATEAEKVNKANEMFVTYMNIKDLPGSRYPEVRDLRQRHNDALKAAFGVDVPQNVMDQATGIIELLIEEFGRKTTEWSSAPFERKIALRKEVEELEQEIARLATAFGGDTHLAHLGLIPQNLRSQAPTGLMAATVSTITIANAFSELFQGPLEAMNAFQERANNDLTQHVQNHYEATDMGGGGDCLFRSLSGARYGNGNEHATFRTRIVAEMRRDPNKYRDLVLERIKTDEMAKDAMARRMALPAGADIVEAYCNWMETAGEWGGKPEIQAYATASGRPIVIMHQHPEEKIEIIDPDLTGRVGGAREPLVITNLRASHFQAMLRPSARSDGLGFAVSAI